MVGVILILLGTFVGAIFISFVGPARERAVAHHRQLLDAEFQEQAKRNPGLATAKLLRKKDEISGQNAVSIHTERIYKCVDGTYLLFICTSSQSAYVEEISSERAKNALRSSPKIFAEEFPNEA